MKLKDLLRTCRDRYFGLTVTALAYYKEDKSYYSFRTLCNECHCQAENPVKNYKNYLSEEELELEVKDWYLFNKNLVVDVIEWI